MCLTGCTGPIPKMEDVQGKWVAIKKEAYILGGGESVGFAIEFFNDYTVSLPSGKVTWSILEDGRLKIDVPQMTLFASIQGDIMTITLPDEKGKVIFKKQ